MFDRTHVLAAVFTVAAFILLASTAFASPLSTDDRAWDDVGTYDLFTKPVAGIAYTPECLGECHKPVAITFAKDTDVSLKDLTYDILSSGGSFTILDSGVNELVTVAYEVPTYTDDCKDVVHEEKAVKNATADLPAKNVTERVCTSKQTGTEKLTWEEWQPYKDHTFKAGNSYVLDLWAKVKPGLKVGKSDVVLSVNGLQLRKASWWDSDWGYRTAVTDDITTDTWTNATQMLTLDTDDFTGLQVDCDDLRVTDADPTTETELTYAWVDKANTVIGCGTHNMTIMVRYRVAANNTFYVYSGNAAAPDGSSADVWSPEVLAMWPFMGDKNDRSGNANTMGAGATFTPISPDNKHVSLKYAAGETTDATALITPALYTFGAWVYWTNKGAYADEHVILNKGSSGFVEYCSNNAGGTLWACDLYQTCTNGNKVTTAATPSLSIGEWHYIGGRYDGTNIEIILDGILGHATACTAPTYDSTPFSIGGNAGQGKRFEGSVMNMVVIDRALSQTEIYALMNTTRPAGITVGDEETPPVIEEPVAPQWTDYGSSFNCTPWGFFNSTWNGFNTSLFEVNFTHAFVNYSATTDYWITWYDRTLPDSTSVYEWRSCVNLTTGRQMLWNCTPWAFLTSSCEGVTPPPAVNISGNCTSCFKPTHEMSRTSAVCLDADNLAVGFGSVMCANGICNNFTSVDTVSCDFGCNTDRNECNPSPFESYLFLAALLTGAGIAVYAVWRWV